MKEKLRHTHTLILLLAAILAIFAVRTLLAAQSDVPRLFDLFDALTLAGSLLVLLAGWSNLKTADWLLAAALGILVAAGMSAATLFSPYPFFGIVRTNEGQALVRGTATFLASLGGLVIMRQGGPVIFRIANQQPGLAWRDTLFGLLLGAPLAVANVFALQASQGKAIAWQSPAAALLDALQPALVEEIVYRFALWGLLWLLLRRLPDNQRAWSAGLLAMLVHNYAHFDELFLQSPLAAIGMGLVLMLLWGLPPTWLARKRGLESAVAFHWIQDVARFLAGF